MCAKVANELIYSFMISFARLVRSVKMIATNFSSSRCQPLRNSLGKRSRNAPPTGISVVVRSDASESAYSLPIQRQDPPSPEKRKLMNLMLLGAVGLPVSQMAYTYLSTLAPPKEGGTGGAQPAKDTFGTPVKSEQWLSSHPAGDRSLVQGLQGDATYLIVTDGGGLQNYGLNSICTHLGCVVPWNAVENKFMCPCHGSQYNPEGSVVRGPAPLPLALAHAEVDDNDVVQLSPWNEADFRTGEKPWWV